MLNISTIGVLAHNLLVLTLAARGKYIFTVDYLIKNELPNTALLLFHDISFVVLDPVHLKALHLTVQGVDAGVTVGLQIDFSSQTGLRGTTLG